MGQVSFTPRSLYPRYPLCRKLGGPQSRYERYGEDKNLFPLQGIETQFLGRPGRSLVTIPNKFSRLFKKETPAEPYNGV
jgi:hypothetical protein